MPFYIAIQAPARPGARTVNARRAASRRLRAAALSFALLFGPGTARAESSEISRAETLLFMSPHLKELQPPSRLHYAFHKGGTLEKGFSDTVDIDITTGPDGSRKGVVRFFSPESARSSTRRSSVPRAIRCCCSIWSGKSAKCRA